MGRRPVWKDKVCSLGPKKLSILCSLAPQKLSILCSLDLRILDNPFIINIFAIESKINGRWTV